MSKLFIFIHVPSTGGNTLIDGFKKKHGEESTFYIPALRKDTEGVVGAIKALSSGERSKIRLIHSHALWYGIHELFDQEPFYFTFMRDPVSRVISQYFKMRRVNLDAPGYLDMHRISAKLPFHHSMRSQNEAPSQYRDFISFYPYAHNHMTILYSRKGAKPYYNMEDCGRADRNSLDQAFAHLSNFSFIGLHDTYAADSAQLSEIMGGIETVSAREARISSQEVERETVNDPRVLAEVVQNNLFDMALYESAKLRGESSRMRSFVVNR